MPTAKAIFIKKAAAMAVLLAAYFLAIQFRSEVWCSILSPLNAFAAAGVLFFSYLKSNRTNNVSITLTLYVLACVIWGIADVMWVVMAFTGGTPEENPVVWFLYVVPNCIFLFCLLFFAVHQFRKWDLVQFVVDLVISGFLVVVLFWIIFLRKDFTSLNNLIRSDFTSVLSILTDILICISICSLFLSVRKGKIPIFLRILATGLGLFALADMLYYYLDFNGLYFPDSLNDFLYILSLVVIAFGALWKTYKDSSVSDLSVVMNTGGKIRWIYLLLYPLVAVLASLSSVAGIRLSMNDLLAFAVPTLLYWAFCKYIQLSLEKEVLLKHSNEILTQRVAEQVRELEFLANQDTLTTLFNRRYFITCLEDTIRNRLTSDTVALLIIDLDRFKTINDTFGHDVGDKVLLDFSYRMIELNNHGATIARLGGDEFAVMLAGKYTQQDIEYFCAEVIDCCGKPFIIGQSVLTLTMSVGIAITAEGDCDARTLMQNADIAMYRAKSQGYNRYQVYDLFMSEDFKKAIEIEALLKQTDVDKDFELFYQPQYALPDKELIGAEALLRWKNPEHGYIPPNVFIPIAEHIDYIFTIGKWVMRETIKQSITWNKQYDLPLKIGFNISTKQFQDADFISMIKTLVTESGVNPAWLDAEITESVMISDENVNDVFSVLRELGVTVSIDDFGSGYSALGYLNKYPFDRIKIDKSLVDTISTRNVSGANVIRAAITMAHATGIQTIAEGVETQEQLDILIQLGCDQVQGYLLGRPVPAAIFEQRYMGGCRKKATTEYL